MVTVCSLKSDSGEHVTVSFDNGTEIRSTLSAVTEAMLFSGKTIDENQLQYFGSLSRNSLALEKAVELLSFRQMSGKELKSKLLQKGISEEAAEYSCEKLYKSGLLNDESYASSVARHYYAKGYGINRIKAEFSKRGISRDLWEDAVSELSDPDELIDSLLKKKLKDPADRKEVQRASAFLYRRGYSWNDIQSALSRVSEQFETEEY